MGQEVLCIVVKYWDQELCKVVTRFFVMPVCNIGIAQALFDAIKSEFDSHSILWSNVVGFASDTARLVHTITF